MRAAASKFKNVQTSFCVLGSAVTSRLARATQQQPPKAAKGVVDGELGELVIIMYPPSVPGPKPDTSLAS